MQSSGATSCIHFGNDVLSSRPPQFLGFALLFLRASELNSVKSPLQGPWLLFSEGTEHQCTRHGVRAI